MMEPIKCIEVEWHEDHDERGDEVLFGREVYIPIDLVDKQTGNRVEQIEKAFRKHTGEDPVHIIGMYEEVLYDQDGDSWDDRHEKYLILNLLKPYRHLFLKEPDWLDHETICELPSEEHLELTVRTNGEMLEILLTETFESRCNDEETDSRIIVHEEWALHDPKSLKEFHERFRRELKEYFKNTSYFLARQRDKYEKLCGEV
jgi:hypothetical protein